MELCGTLIHRGLDGGPGQPPCSPGAEAEVFEGGLILKKGAAGLTQPRVCLPSRSLSCPPRALLMAGMGFTPKDNGRLSTADA